VTVLSQKYVIPLKETPYISFIREKGKVLQFLPQNIAKPRP
jgi:hypothetical protein